MSFVATLTLVGFALAAVATWVAVARGWKRLEYAAKPAALGLLCLFALARPEPHPTLVIALLFSLIGDVLLMLPRRFLAGLVAFALAHVSYNLAFAAPWSARLVWLGGLFLLSSPLAILVIRKITRPPMRSAVLAYIVLVELTVASAAATHSPLAIAGAALFLASDAIIGYDRFVRPLGWARPLLLILYHVGQLLLTLSLAV